MEVTVNVLLLSVLISSAFCSLVFMVLVLCFHFKGHLYAVTYETSQANETSQVSESGN